MIGQICRCPEQPSRVVFKQADGMVAAAAQNPSNFSTDVAMVDVRSFRFCFALARRREGLKAELATALLLFPHFNGLLSRQTVLSTLPLYSIASQLRAIVRAAFVAALSDRRLAWLASPVPSPLVGAVQGRFHGGPAGFALWRRGNVNTGDRQTATLRDVPACAAACTARAAGAGAFSQSSMKSRSFGPALAAHLPALAIPFWVRANHSPEAKRGAGGWVEPGGHCDGTSLAINVTACATAREVIG